jgi:hypothetical protein
MGPDQRPAPQISVFGDGLSNYFTVTRMASVSRRTLISPK